MPSKYKLDIWQAATAHFGLEIDEALTLLGYHYPPEGDMLWHERLLGVRERAIAQVETLLDARNATNL